MSREGEVEELSSLPEGAAADLDGKRRAVLASMPCLEGNDFSSLGALRKPGDGRFVHAHVEIAGMHADQLLAAIAEAFARLPVDVDDRQMLVDQKERVGRMIDERPEARLARTERLPGAPAPGTELAEQQTETDEDDEAQRIIGRQLERIRRRDDPVQNSRCADQHGEQAGSASTIPGA
jgi:hypothetical protein